MMPVNGAKIVIGVGNHRRKEGQEGDDLKG